LHEHGLTRHQVLGVRVEVKLQRRGVHAQRLAAAAAAAAAELDTAGQAAAL
jgi:hypothetical protein